MRRKPHGIFCLEADWWSDFNRTSTVQPVLHLLEQGMRTEVPHVHRDVGTREELALYLSRWSQRRHAQYRILYLAFHGAPGHILLGDRRRNESEISLDELAEMLGTGLSGRLVHFGSCETLAADRRLIRNFLDRTGLVAASGFRTPVDWLDSAVFEVLLFEVMLRYSLTVQGARAVRATMRKEHPTMCRTHDFRMVVRLPQRKRAKRS
ncbi:MAG TPA: DUF6642 family protein [Longimicrobiales bacterium]|nr:DUF6642 family protein [Longimicrobiales bacterium]